MKMKFERINTRKKFKEQLLGPKRFREIIVPAIGIPQGSGGAYTLAFVYSNTGNFLVKGYHDEVEKYIKRNFDKYFVNYSLWSQGHSRNIWDFWKESIGIFPPSKRNDKWEIRCYGTYNKKGHWHIKEKNTLLFKRLPKCWVKELEIL